MMIRAIEVEHDDLGAIRDAKGDVAQDSFVGRDDVSHFVHGVDDLSGFVCHWSSG